MKILIKQVPANEVGNGTEIALLKKYFDANLIDDPKDLVNADENEGSKSYPINVTYASKNYIYSIKAYKTKDYSKDRRLIINSNTDPLGIDRKEGDYLCLMFDNKITKDSKVEVKIISKTDKIESVIKLKYKPSNGLILDENNDSILFKFIKDLNIKHPLNQILFGPPGTGKTYNTINKAIEIVNPTFDLTQDREIVKEEFERLMRNEQILFTTFHQSMSYEDFIEGIKPDEPKPNQALSYSIQAGIFKKACANAGYLSYREYLKSQKQTQAYSFDDLYDAFITSIQALLDNNSAPIYKTFRGRDVEVKEINSNDSIIARAKDSIAKSSAPLTKENLQKLYDKFKSIDDIKDLTQVKETVEITPRITEFYAVFGGLKEFEKTFKPNSNTLIESSEVGTIDSDENQKKYDAGVYYNAIKEFGKNAEPVVLVIDEINRGNVSQIFGELITLIEDDKRLGKTEELEIILPYSKKKFSVPPNLYIVGTMNTADRSVEALDTALRRRFVFEEIPPKYDLKELQYEYAGVKACDILQTINKRIEKLLDKDHLIGHSYFILKDGEKPNEKLKNSFYKSILPLLQEYFFGDFGKIGLVLGQGFVNLKNWDDKVDSFAEFDHESSGDFESKDVYEIIDYREPTNYEVNKVKMDFEKAIKRLMKLNIA
jgi:5-methylcytosine-specific restriction protein B